jgi:3-polyprenyl-4-hydroxybenzoate decarboxylase
LREWLARVAALGDLIEVKEPVSCEEEMSAIGYLVAKQKSSPAIISTTSEDTRRVFTKRARYETFLIRACHESR